MSIGTENQTAPEGFDDLALYAFNGLSKDEQEQLVEFLEGFSARPFGDWPAGEVRQLPGDQPEYLVTVSPNLYLIARIEAGKPLQVLDLVRPETLKTFKAFQDA